MGDYSVTEIKRKKEIMQFAEEIYLKYKNELERNEWCQLQKYVKCFLED